MKSAAQGQHGALSGPEPGKAQGEAAASRSCQGSLDGTAPTPGPESASAATTKRRSRVWWFWRFVRAYHKHDCWRGVRRTWEDAMSARRMMTPADQWKLGPLGTVQRG